MGAILWNWFNTTDRLRDVQPQPTTYMGAAVDVYNEGSLIFPAVKIQDDYQHVMDIVRMCQMRIRVPEQWWGDYLATLGAAALGASSRNAIAALLPPRPRRARGKWRCAPPW